MKLLFYSAKLCPEVTRTIKLVGRNREKFSSEQITGEEAKNLEKIEDDEDEVVYPRASKEVKNENEVPISRSLLALNGKPFSAVQNGVLVKYFDEPPEK